jgi:hypothetical protein
LKKDYQSMSRVSFANILRFKQIRNALEPFKTQIRPDLLSYVDFGIKFNRTFGMWALISHNELLIKKEDYTKKSFSRLSQEIYSMADQALALCNEIKKMKPDNGNISFCQTYIQIFEPTCVK